MPDRFSLEGLKEALRNRKNFNTKSNTVYIDSLNGRFVCEVCTANTASASGKKIKCTITFPRNTSGKELTEYTCECGTTYIKRGSNTDTSKMTYEEKLLLIDGE